MKPRVILLALTFWLALAPPTQAYFTSYTTLSNNVLETADWSPPSSTVRFGERTIAELVTNGSFRDGTLGWNTRGDVFFTDDSVIIGKSGGMLNDNAISQTFRNTSKNLSFTYRIFSTEPLRGLDDPCFETQINDTPVLTVDCDDIDDVSTWQRFSIELADFPTDQISLTFLAGNSGDDEQPSWVELRNVSTSEVIGNTSQVLSVITKDMGSAVRSFMADCDNTTTLIANELRLPAHEQCALSIWSEDLEGNTEIPISVSADVADSHTFTEIGIERTIEPTGEVALTLSPAASLFTVFSLQQGDHPILREEFDRYKNKIFLPLNQDSDETYTLAAMDVYHNKHIFTE